MFTYGRMVSTLAALRGRRPTLVLVSVRVPRVGNVSVVTRVGRARVAIMTVATRSADVLRRLLGTNFSRYLFGPFDVRGLSSVLKVRSRPRLSTRSKAPSRPSSSSRRGSGPRLSTLLTFTKNSRRTTGRVLSAIGRRLTTRLAGLGRTMRRRSLSASHVKGTTRGLLPVTAVVRVKYLRRLGTLSPRCVNRVRRTRVETGLGTIVAALSTTISSLCTS